MPPTDDSPRELQAAADELGVHYQTAYRWVRSGELPARLQNGRYLIDAGDIEALRHRRDAPRAPRRPGARRVARRADAIYDAVAAGDEAVARSAVSRLVTEGMGVAELIDSVLAPALRRVGEAWVAGELSIAQEHRASAIVERILGEVAPNPRGRRRGTAVTVTAPGDAHVLPSIMAAMALRGANWRVDHLGGNLPADEIVTFCERTEPDVVVLSVTTESAAPAAEVVAARIRTLGIPAVIGRSGHPVTHLLDTVQTATG